MEIISDLNVLKVAYNKLKSKNICIFSNICKRFHAKKNFYEKVKMTTRRTTIFESFVTLGLFDYDRNLPILHQLHKKIKMVPL
jgi:hypothetical protein